VSSIGQNYKKHRCWCNSSPWTRSWSLDTTNRAMVL